MCNLPPTQLAGVVRVTQFCGGAAGNRTPVQTSNQIAFYMLIFLLIFEIKVGKSTRFNP